MVAKIVHLRPSPLISAEDYRIVEKSCRRVRRKRDGQEAAHGGAALICVTEVLRYSPASGRGVDRLKESQEVSHADDD
jgi:hypothetical protein